VPRVIGGREPFTSSAWLLLCAGSLIGPPLLRMS
jgi:hypothetical protein